MGKTQRQKNIISQQNIQLIEQIGEGEFGTGNISLTTFLLFFHGRFSSIQSILEDQTKWTGKKPEPTVFFLALPVMYLVNRGRETFT